MTNQPNTKPLPPPTPIRDILLRHGLDLQPVAEDDEVYQSGAWVFFLSSPSACHTTTRQEVDQDDDVTLSDTELS